MKKLKVLLLCVVLISTMGVLGAAGQEEVVEKDSDNIVIGVLLKTLANPYWVSMKEGIEAEAKNMDGVEIEIFAAESEQDVAGQLNMFENMIDSGKYDAFAVAPITPNNLITGVVRANKMGYPVVNIDEKFDMDELAAAGAYVVGYATSDNKKVGRLAAELIIEKIGTSGGVGIVEGQAGATSGELRRDGAREAFEAAGVEILSIQPGNWDRQVSLDVATNMINRYGDKLKGLFTANDTMALGVLQAMKNTGRTDIVLVSTDANSEVQEAIKRGELSAVVQSPQGIGVACVEMAVKAVKEGNAGSLDQEPETQLIAATVVTPESY